MLSLEAAKELMRYRLQFLRAVVHASPLGEDHKVRKKLKKLFNQSVHDTDDEKVWNRAAVAIFQFIYKQRQRERRTDLECPEEGEEDNAAAMSPLASRSEWVKSMSYIAHFHHLATPALFRGEGLDKLTPESASDNSGPGDSEATAIAPTAKQPSLPNPEKDETPSDFDTDNEDHYHSDYELSADGRMKRADWHLDHYVEVTKFIVGLNEFLRPAAGSCRAVLAPQVLAL